MASTPLSGSNIVKSQAVIVACSSVKRSRYGVLETRSAGAENASAVPFPVVDVLNGSHARPQRPTHQDLRDVAELLCAIATPTSKQSPL